MLIPTPVFKEVIIVLTKFFLIMGRVTKEMYGVTGKVGNKSYYECGGENHGYGYQVFQ